MAVKNSKKKISDFKGILSKESAEAYGREIKRNREERNHLHKNRIKLIDEKLITRNKKHFSRIKNLKIEGY